MSPRLLRIDAMVFRADSVRFEPCPSFRAGLGSQLCDCGWLEHEHAVAEVALARPRRFPRRRSVRVALPAAS
jgi:hypothetical protein